MSPLGGGSIDVAAFDNLELELRKLPGVASVGFSGQDRDLTLHVAVPSAADRSSVRGEAEGLARAHLDYPISVAINVLGEVAHPPDVDTDRVLRSVSNDWASSAAAAVLSEADPAQPDALQLIEFVERRQSARSAEPAEWAVPPPPAPSAVAAPPAVPPSAAPSVEPPTPAPSVRGRPGERAVVDRPGPLAAGPVTAGGSPEPTPGLVRTRPRVALLGVHLVDGGREVEVHLGHGTHRTVGRGEAGRTSSTAVATLRALEELGMAVPFTVRSAVRLGLGVDGAVAVILGGPEGERMGLGRAPTPDHAAVKATLQALNRFLEDPRRTGARGA